MHFREKGDGQIIVVAEYFLFRKYPFSLELQAIALCAGRSRQNDWGVLRLVRDDGKRATVK